MAAASGSMPLFVRHPPPPRMVPRPLIRGAEGDCPCESPEQGLKEVRRLIENHGYGRREAELEDAETALRAIQNG